MDEWCTRNGPRAMAEIMIMGRRMCPRLHIMNLVMLDLPRMNCGQTCNGNCVILCRVQEGLQPRLWKSAETDQALAKTLKTFKPVSHDNNSAGY